MDIFSASFLTALFTIIVIDIVLAGDNAIVIALAARKLPPDLRKKAVIFGAVGAVVVRCIMTLGVVWLLAIPGLRFAGGLALLWIGYKLLVPTSGDEHNVDASTTFLGAMKTIVIADAVMGIDNVLAVAGAAHGSYVLVVLGLVISVPIVVWGSTLILKYTEKYPSIIFIGAGVLAFTASKMMLAEPFFAPYLAGNEWINYVAYVVCVGGILLIGREMNSKQQTSSLPAFSQNGDVKMSKALIPVNGHADSLQAVHKFISERLQNPGQKAVLFNVQPALQRHASRFLNKGNMQNVRSEQADNAMKEAEALLSNANIPYEKHWVVGDRTKEIVKAAEQHNCGRVLLVSNRKNLLAKMVANSLTAKVLQSSHVPVEIIPGRQSSVWQRVGIPAGVGAAIATLTLAID
jgi:YjbE family integral membrane protein